MHGACCFRGSGGHILGWNMFNNSAAGTHCTLLLFYPVQHIIVSYKDDVHIAFDSIRNGLQTKMRHGVLPRYNVNSIVLFIFLASVQTKCAAHGNMNGFPFLLNVSFSFNVSIPHF